MSFFQRLSVKTFIVSIIATLIIAIFIIQSNIKKAESITNSYSDIIEKTIESFLNISEMPEVVVLAEEESFTHEKFNDTATYIFRSYPYKFLSFTKDSVVQFVYPYEDYKHLLGTDGFFVPDESHLNQIALSSNETLFYLYYHTYSHDRWIFIKNPIVKKSSSHTEEFLGFITIAFSLNDVIANTGVENLEQLGYKYQLQLVEEDELSLIYKSNSYSNIFATHRIIHTGGSEWIFSIASPFMTLVNPLLILLIFLSMRCVYYMYIYTKQRKINLRKQLNYELYVDSLTGAYNKKKLENLLDNKKTATVLYVAIQGYDAFKEKHGQSFADGLLIAYSKRVKYNVKGGLVIHLGTEEFVVFLEGKMTEEAIQSVIKRVTELSLQPFSIMGEIARIHAQVGYSTMPDDSAKFTSLLNIAMERSKK